jgi:hypothetical protein
VGEEFKDHGINLFKFSNGKEFVKSVSSYADDEIKNKVKEKRNRQTLIKLSPTRYGSAK